VSFYFLGAISEGKLRFVRARW